MNRSKVSLDKPSNELIDISPITGIPDRSSWKWDMVRNKKSKVRKHMWNIRHLFDIAANFAPYLLIRYGY